MEIIDSSNLTTKILLRCYNNIMKRKISLRKRGNKGQGSREHLPKDLRELEHDELSGYENKESSLAASSTDENEDEGLGDGNMSRSDKDLLSK
jgi:hypothetical protein